MQGLHAQEVPVWSSLWLKMLAMQNKLEATFQLQLHHSFVQMPQLQTSERG